MKRLFTIAILAGALAVVLPSAAPTAAQPVAPLGVTGLALNGAVELAWQPVSGATSYNVYRGATVDAVTTLVSPAGVTGTTFRDSTPANGTAYFYAVRAAAAGAESTSSHIVQATPVTQACSTGNAVVLENCYPGNNPWNVRNTATIAAGGIEGFATATSINKGGSVDLKVNSADATTFRVEVYRTGYYGGAGARLFSVIRGVPGTAQTPCTNDSATGLYDCSNWTTSLTLSTTDNWPSGVYAIRLVRDDTGTDNQILLAVRDDGRTSQVVYGVAFANFEAYNNYGGRSLYDFNSNGSATVAGTSRAVKVSYDRPFEQPRSGLRDWYTRTEAATVYWLEQAGYDVSYISNTDLETNPGRLTGRKAYISPSHDEYVSAAMRNAMQSARDAGVGLFFSGGNEIYWKIRFENGPNGGTNRVEVSYKTTQSGGPDPSGIPTGTWRDPNGANNPENALTGIMYVGDNDNTYFPFQVGAVEGADRVYRYTGLDQQPAGTSTRVGNGIIGWEWDARVANGFEPAGVKTLASSPVSGELIQNNGANYNPSGSATVHMVKYTAASGALVVSAGTNHWNRGLAPNATGAGEPDSRIQQITTNALADMGALPQTPAPGIQLDNAVANRPDAPTDVAARSDSPDSTTITWTAVPGADGYNVYRTLAGRTDSQPLGALANAALTTGTSFTDIGLTSATAYYYVIVAVKGGVQSLPSVEATVTTAAGAGQPTRIDAGSTSSFTSSTAQQFLADTFATGGNVRTVNTAISGTTNQKLYQSERWGLFSYAIPVANGTYNVRFHFAETYYGTPTVPACVGARIFSMDIVDTAGTPDVSNLDICAAVGPAAADVVTVANVTVSDGILNIKSINGSVDSPTLGALEVIPTAITPPTVTATVPTSGELDVGAGAFPRATFSRAMDASTITTTTATLAGPHGAVPASVAFDAASRTVTLTPTAALEFSAVYTVTLAASIKSSDGAPLGTAYSWSFTTQSAPPADVDSTSPDFDAVDVGPTTSVRATFTRAIDPATVTSAGFTLRSSSGALVPATVSYNASTRTATLAPTSMLALTETYTARLATTIHTTDGVPLAAPYAWSFTTANTAPAAPTVLTTVPATGAIDVASTTAITAAFSRAMDPSTLTTATFAVSSPGGTVPGTVSYDAATTTASFTPAAALPPSTTFTVQLLTSIRAADGTALAAPPSWTFTTVSGPTVTGTTPTDGSSYVSRSSVATVSFSRSMDAASITASTLRLFAPDGSVVPAAVSYDDASKTARLNPTSPLTGGVTFAASVDGSVRAVDGTPLGSPVSWKFTTGMCTCSLFSVVQQPASQSLPTRDGRSGFGPWTYEMGVKFRVDEPMRLNGIRFWKSPGEVGTHVSNLWTANGALIASTTATSETASGWQVASFASPPLLQAGVTYIASTNANSYYAVTPYALGSQVISGPVRSVADGANGVFAGAAGQFPTQTYRTSNYFADVELVPDGDPPPPTVTATSPAANATEVDANVPLSATFSRPMNPATITASTFNVRQVGTSSGADAGGAVDATVTYNDATNTVKLTPSAPLTHGVQYTATLTTAIRAQDGKALANATSWTFAVSAPPPPLSITSSSPASAATGVNYDAGVKLTFNRAIDPATATASTVRLVAPDGTAVASSLTYEPFGRTLTIQPSAALAVNTTYTVSVTTGLRTSDGTSMLNPYGATFTTGTCPCSLLTGLTPVTVNNPTQDGRSGAGPWSYELGMKIAVDQPASLAGVRYWKSSRETGSHTGRIWSSTGALIATVAFSSETAGGWQQANFATPIALAAGTTYVVSVNANGFFATTRSGLAAQRTNGIAHTVADGRNGVFGSAAGVFPTGSFSNTNYFVDVVVR